MPIHSTEASCSVEQAAATGLAGTKKRKVTHNARGWWDGNFSYALGFFFSATG